MAIIAGLALIVWGRLETVKILPADPSASELFYLYLKILVVVTVLHYVVVYLYMRFLGTYE
jgi:hypothetical protein